MFRINPANEAQFLPKPSNKMKPSSCQSQKPAPFYADSTETTVDDVFYDL